MSPKVFISYSWSTQIHKDMVRGWADQLMSEGVGVVIDVYDLKEGDDKYFFMEKMVIDETVTHVLMFCDKKYSEKANARESGVGTESQIISQKIYNQVSQSKFLPIICEFDDEGEACLPIFMQSRIWFDFSTPESVNKNWEGLLRILYNKPQYIKPELGKAPSYITNDSAQQFNPSLAKYNIFRQSFIDDRKNWKIHRQDFLDVCLKYADDLRLRDKPVKVEVIEVYRKLKVTRDELVNWVLLETTGGIKDDFNDQLIEVLEKLNEIKSKPKELHSWSENWFDGHKVFVMETFIYIIAALIRNKAFSTLHEIFTSHYILPESDLSPSASSFENFGCFHTYSESLERELREEGTDFYSPMGEVFKRNADREDISLNDFVEAEALIILMAAITPSLIWYPSSQGYSSFSKKYPFFLRASQYRYFKNLATITGIETADLLRSKAKQGWTLLQLDEHKGYRPGRSLWEKLNLDELDTLK